MEEGKFDIQRIKDAESASRIFHEKMSKLNSMRAEINRLCAEFVEYVRNEIGDDAKVYFMGRDGAALSGFDIGEHVQVFTVFNVDQAIGDSDSGS